MNETVVRVCILGIVEVVCIVGLIVIHFREKKRKKKPTYDALCACKMQKKRAHWVADFERNEFECSSCKHRSRIASLYCPWCGKEMEDLKYEL